MDVYVAVTDNDWFRFLRKLDPRDEVNFWQPNAGTTFRALIPGEPLLFKLHAPENFVVGGGFFLRNIPRSPAYMAWEAFGEKNGTRTFEDMRHRIARYRRTGIVEASTEIGCVILVEPFFFAEPDWIPAPLDFHPNIVRGKGYNTQTGEGEHLWGAVLERLGGIERDRRWGTGRLHPIADEAPMYGDPILVRQRLGQGAFRMTVMDTYGRRCAVTGEKAIPTLEAAHILPVAEGGQHRIENGLLLRSDVHRLFDKGYVTVTPELRFRVSQRLRTEFDNGAPYFPYDGASIQVPNSAIDQPSRQLLEWHADVKFRS